MSRDKAIVTVSDLPHGKAGKRTHQYLPGFREVLQDLLPALKAVSVHTCPHWEDEVWTTSAQNEEQGSRVGVFLVHPTMATSAASHRVYGAILHYFKVSLHSSNFLRRITTISVTRTPYWCYGIYYSISTAYRWFARNWHRSLGTSGLHQVWENT